MDEQEYWRDCGDFKKSESETVTTINFMSFDCNGFRDHVFLGFIPLTDDYGNLGVSIDGTDYTACHLFRCDREFSYYTTDDAPEPYVEKPYILLYEGNDDISYFERFKTEKEAIEHFKTVDIFDEVVYKRCYMHN